MSELIPADFDFDIGEILLVHRNSHIHNFRYTEYRTGRSMDGLVLCISGRAVYDCPDERFTLGPGQMLFLPSNMAYTMRCDSMEPFLHFTVNFRLSAVRARGDHPVSEIITGKRRQLSELSAGSRFPELFERLLSVWQAKRSGYLVMAKSILGELLYLYFTDAARSMRDADSYERLRPAKQALDKPGAAEYTIGELAEMCSLSETHFRRLFGTLFGMTPTEYRMNKRILRAKDLLLSGQYTVTEVARETGFSDPSYFAKVFRTHTGAAPRDFMRS